MADKVDVLAVLASVEADLRRRAKTARQAGRPQNARELASRADLLSEVKTSVADLIASVNGSDRGCSCLGGERNLATLGGSR